jgi:hypothetical protein
MRTLEMSIQTSQGAKIYLCILKNEKDSIYQIVNSDGNDNPQSIEWNNNGGLKIVCFNGLRIIGNEVFTFTSLMAESYKLGILASH